MNKVTECKKDKIQTWSSPFGKGDILNLRMGKDIFTIVTSDRLVYLTTGNHMPKSAFYPEIWKKVDCVTIKSGECQ